MGLVAEWEESELGPVAEWEERRGCGVDGCWRPGARRPVSDTADTVILTHTYHLYHAN